VNAFWSPSIRSLTAYTPGEQPGVANLIKLNTNENPYPPSPRVIEALHHASSDDLRLYPDPQGKALQQVIAEQHGLTLGHVFLGNGSDEVLAHAFLALLKHDLPIFFPDVSYSFYPVYCALYGIAFEAIAVDAQYQVDLAAYARPNGGIVLPNPNAPTGSALGRDALRGLLAQHPSSVVLIDEAYVDFGAESVVPWVQEFPNLLVVQTLSKSRSLAGLRVGFAIGDPGLIAALELVKNCFNSYPLDRLALAGAKAAMLDTAYFENTCQRIIQSRDKLAEDLTTLGFEVLPSQANFIFVRHPAFDAKTLAQQLRQHNILVRHFAKPRIDQFLRISIDTNAECHALVTVLRQLLG
jgi:histidinol-phosphate aminotransferase